MARYSAVTLDLSRFPPPLAIRDVTYEGILAARKNALQAAFDKYDIPYDVAMLETDPAIILEEADAYRELLTLAAINDAVRAGLVAFAVGSDLDHLAAFYGVTRFENETNDDFRRRVLLAPEAFAAAGPEGAYVYHALTADPRVLNADVWSPASGKVAVAIQSREGDGAASDELLTVVRSRLNRRDIKPLTDMVSVQSVENVPYAIDVEAFILPGPDEVMVRESVLASLTKMAADRRTPSRDMPLSAIHAAAMVGPVDKVIVKSPLVDLARDRGEVALCTGINVKVTIYNG